MTQSPVTRRALRESASSDGGAQGETPVPETAPADAEAPPAAQGTRVAGILGEIVLWIVAAAGLICIILVVLAITAHITLIMFRTGSMAPAIPAGSVAIVQQIPASQVRVGDVVTVDRPGRLPVTHRVRQVAPGTSSEQRRLTLRGDANAQDDIAPYPVTTVRIARFAIPGVAPVIVAFGNPFLLGGLTIAVAALVVWAFWPRGAGTRRPNPDDGVHP